MAKKSYTREFKLKVVRAVERGELRPAQACREYQIAESVLNRWRHEVRLRGEAAFTPLETTTATTDYEAQIAELERVCGQLAVENAALKKACSVSSPSPAPTHEHLAAGVSQPVTPPALPAAGRQSFLVLRPVRPAPRPTRDGALRDAIERIVLEFPGYGERRVTAELRRQKRDVNHKRVLRIMRAESLLCQLRRSRLSTTDSRHGLRTYPNLLAGVVLTRPNQAWVAVITYVRLPTAFVFLACILDAWSRRCIGWHLSRSIDTQLTLVALNNAVSLRQPSPGFIHHSDRGVQYASTTYTQRLATLGAQISRSAKGNPYIIPLKWRVTDATGAPITNLSSITVTSVVGGCSVGSASGAVEEYATTTSGLQNLGNGYYQFNWKTEKSWAGSCRTLRLDLGDGIVRTALFQFR